MVFGTILTINKLHTFKSLAFAVKVGMYLRNVDFIVLSKHNTNQKHRQFLGDFSSFIKNNKTQDNNDMYFKYYNIHKMIEKSHFNLSITKGNVFLCLSFLLLKK